MNPGVVVIFDPPLDMTGEVIDIGLSVIIDFDTLTRWEGWIKNPWRTPVGLVSA